MQVRCRSHMTSALRAEGIGLKADDTTDRLHEWDSDKGEGSKNPKFFTDAICERTPKGREARKRHLPSQAKNDRASCKSGREARRERVRQRGSSSEVAARSRFGSYSLAQGHFSMRLPPPLLLLFLLLRKRILSASLTGR